jgi:ATP synthase protein I
MSSSWRNEVKDDRQERLRELRSSASLSTVGLTLALSVGLGIGFGLLLDHVFKTNWIVIVGVLFGVIAGFKQLFDVVSRINRDEEAQKAREAGERRGKDQ